MRVLDDRSLNGIQVNGRRVEWSPVTDGDEISIGRHVLYFLDTTKAANRTEEAALSEGMEAKSREFVEKGAEVYSKA